MSMRRRLQSFLPSGHGADGGAGAGAIGGGSRRRLLWIALASMVALALFSMATLSSSPSLRLGGATTNAVPSSGGDPLDAKLLAKRAQTASVADSLARLSLATTTTPRGIVLPLFNGIVFLGISLIMELRAMGITLPIEVPHCGDLDEKLRLKLAAFDTNVRVYDVCLEASSYSFSHGEKRKIFCKNVGACQNRFRNFDVKIISLLLSRFEQVMMLDADTLFFENPMKIWESPKYQETGTLFFHDRVSCDHEFLADVRKKRGNISHLQEYLLDFDVSPFHQLDKIQRPRAMSPQLARLPDGAMLHFEPSEFLMTSHSWNRRAGHQADSSLMLWDKKRQPRATAILGSFIAHGGTGRPPSYGDKELYFIACELAETAYAFSEYGTGAIGSDARHPEDPGNSVLCGDALHYMPDASGTDDPRVLYINSDHITKWDPSSDNLFRTKARPAALYPGKIETRGYAQECPFDVTLTRVTTDEMGLLAKRQRFHSVAVSWNATVTAP